MQYILITFNTDDLCEPPDLFFGFSNTINARQHLPSAFHHPVFQFPLGFSQFFGDSTTLPLFRIVTQYYYYSVAVRFVIEGLLFIIYLFRPVRKQIYHLT